MIGDVQVSSIQEDTFLLPLTTMQQGMLFHTLLEPESSVYFQQFLMRLKGALDVPDFEEAWRQVLQRHDALRAGFVWEGRERPVQIIHKHARAPFVVIDWRHIPELDQDERLQVFLREDRSAPFDLARPPLMRFTIVRMSDDAYAFVWSHHHLLLDGWSTSIILEEITTIYNALRGVQRPQLPEPPTYSAFHAWLGDRNVGASRRFWSDVLSDFDSPTPLGIGQRPEPGSGTDFMTLHRKVDGHVAHKLDGLTRRLGLSASIPILAAWAFVISRYSGKDDVVFGVTVSGRSPQLANAERMVGLFINTLPLRVSILHDVTVGDWLGSLQKRLLDLQDFDHVSLLDIQTWSPIPKGAPLFESIVVFENYPLGSAGIQGLEGAQILDIRIEERANYPLVLLCEPSAVGLNVSLIVDRTRVSEEAGLALIDQMTWLLEQFAECHHETTPCHLSLLRPGERDLVLHGWNDTVVAYERDATLPLLFERQVAADPDAVAIVDDDGEVSYRDLNLLSSRIARRIVAHGARRGDCIALHMGRDRYLLAAMLGVLKAGCAYVPLDLQIPAARAQHILDELGIKIIISQGNHASNAQACLAGRNITVLVAEENAGLEYEFTYAGQSTDLAYVIFTSGSTGIPKGVRVCHRPVINLIEWVNKTFGVGPADRLLFVTAPSFDLSVYDVFGILSAGGSVRIVSDAQLADPESLVRLLIHEPITFWDSAPAALWQLLSLLPAKTHNHPLRLAFVSGDWAPLDLPLRLKSIFDNVEIVVLGGATEATVWSNFHVVGSIDPSWVSIPYGRPIQNARYYILDQVRHPLPAGVAGDLYIGGECLAMGYTGAPELTAQRFVKDPYGIEPDAIMYATGDRARFDANGIMEFLGRTDQQVKVRGFRIELGEIETVLSRHGGVQNVAVIVRTSGEGGPANGDFNCEIVAYVVPREGVELKIGVLLTYLRARLPAQMIPAFIIFQDCLPLTSNGKVDRKVLPAPTLVDKGQADDRNSDPLLEIVKNVWCDVLGQESFPSDANFFDLGGHSLRATSVVSRLRGALGIEIPLRLIFTHPTAASLSRAIGDLRGQIERETQIPLICRDSGNLSLPKAQARLWFLHQINPDSPFYNMALAARLRGRTDINTVSQAFKAVIARHEILRTRIEERAGQPFPVIEPPDLAPPVFFEDFTDRDPANQETEVASRFQIAALRPFDLSVETPLRMLALKLSDDDFAILVMMDHIASDGWSIGVFAHEFLHFHDVAMGERGAALPELAAQYLDYAAWHEGRLESGVLESQLGYWRKHLAGLRELSLPTDRPRPAIASLEGGVLHFALTPVVSNAIKTLCRKEATTLFSVLAAAFAVVLRRLSGQDDVVFGTDAAGRRHEAAEALIGFFINQLVLRFDLAGLSTFRDVLKSVQPRVLDALANQDVPFDALVQHINPPRQPGKMPLFQVKLVLQNGPFSSFSSRYVQFEPIVVDTKTAKYDLLLTFSGDDVLAGKLEFSSDLFDKTTAEAMVGEIKLVLETVAMNPDISCASLAQLVTVDRRMQTALTQSEIRRAGLAKLKAMRSPNGVK